MVNKRTKAAATLVGLGLAGSMVGLGVSEATQSFEKDPYEQLVDATRCSEQLGQGAMEVTILPEACEEFSFNNTEVSSVAYEGYYAQEGVTDTETTYFMPSTKEFLDTEAARIESSHNDPTKGRIRVALVGLGALLGLGLGSRITHARAKTKPKQPANY